MSHIKTFKSKFQLNIVNCLELFRLKERNFSKAKLRKIMKAHKVKGSILIWIK